jgi:hypothetical protein
MPLILRADQLGDKVVGGFHTPPGNQFAEIPGELHSRGARLGGSGLVVVDEARLEDPGQLRRPRRKARMITGRNSQQLADNPNRQRIGELTDHVEPAGIVVGGVRQQLMRNIPDSRGQLRHHPGCEGP